MSPSTAFLDTLKARRSIYALSKSSPIPDSAIQDIVTQAILHTPTSFNSQTTRAILLVKGEHDKLWDIAKEVLKGIVPADQYEATETRLSGFQAGYGT
ncbi:putative nitroreductase, partial [Lachnellula arida]